MTVEWISELEVRAGGPDCEPVRVSCDLAGCAGSVVIAPPAWNAGFSRHRGPEARGRRAACSASRDAVTGIPDVFRLAQKKNHARVNVTPCAARSAGVRLKPAFQAAA